MNSFRDGVIGSTSDSDSEDVGFESLSRNFDKIKWLYSHGFTGVEISKKLNLSAATISYHLSKIRTPEVQKSKFDWKTISQEYTSTNISFRELRRKYKISGGALTNAIAKGKLIPKEKKTLEELLARSKRMSTTSLKKTLFRLNLLENKCSECGLLPVWNDKPLTLQLDHKDGNRKNNVLDNLRILCPHCHTQTSTWGRKARSNFSE